MLATQRIVRILNLTLQSVVLLLVQNGLFLAQISHYFKSRTVLDLIALDRVTQ